MLARVRVCLIAAIAGLLWVAPRAAHAQSCKNLGATAVAFGTYNVFTAADLTGVGTISYSCPPPLAPVVAISASANGAYKPRQMTAGANTLAYELYKDAAMTVVWGVGADQQAVPSGNGKTASVYARLFQQQDAAVGAYSDTITVTFNF
jgi:spore coat protein U-like protein